MKYRLLKFEKEGCGPCIAVQNFLDDANVEVERIMAYDNPKKSSEYEIGSLPTIILLEDGKEIKRSTGFKPDELEEMVEVIKKQSRG